MEKLICPSCHIKLNNRLSLPLTITCGSCNTTLLCEKDKQVTLADNKWSKPYEISCLNLLSKGNYNGKGFELIGRIRSISSSTINNDWLMYFEDGNYLWLIESGFNYFISEVMSTPLILFDVKNCKGGSLIRIQNDDYIVNDLSKQLHIEVQGEIPKDSYNNELYFKCELTSALNTDWATICIYDKNTVEVVKCKKVELKELNLEDITEFKEWL